MPPVLAIGAAVAGSVISTSLGAAIAGTAITTAMIAGAAAAGLATGVLSYAAQALMAPDKPSVDTGTTEMSVQPITAHQVVYGRCRVSGPLVFCRTMDPGSGKLDHLHMAVVLAGHEIEAVESHWFGDDELDLDADGKSVGEKYKNVAWITPHLGSPDQAADPGLMAAFPGVWTSAHRIRGRAYIHVKCKADRNSYSGIPSYSAVIKGRKVYDPRSGQTAWSNNPALCILDYLTSSFGLSALIADEIDVSSFITAANDCDFQVATLVVGVTEKRYTCDGAFTLDEEPSRVLEKLLSSCAGRLVCVSGRWRLKVGVADTAVVSVGIDTARGPVRFRANRSRRDLVNTVRGSFVSEAHHWQQTDYPTVQDASAVAADNGEASATLDLPFTKSHTTAQRIAWIYLRENRAQRSARLECNLVGLRVSGGDTVSLTLDRFDVQNQPYLVESWKMTDDLGVDMSLVEHQAAIYAHPTLQALAVAPDAA